MRDITLQPAGGAPFTLRLETRRNPAGQVELSLSTGSGDFTGVLDSRGASEGVLWGGHRARPYVAARVGDELHLWLDGEVYRFRLACEEAVRRGAGALPSTGEVTAPMPGKVLRVLVAVGDRPEAGAPLVVLESMKMELTVAAPGVGTVADVPAQAGAMVDVGTVLVRLESPA